MYVFKILVNLSDLYFRAKISALLTLCGAEDGA